MSIVKKLLSNNTVLITEPIATVKTAAIGFWFSVGSRYESDDLRGISHFVEHMIFKGTPTRSAYDIACAFDKIGGYVNAYTEREQVCVQCVVPSVYADYALEILCDMTQNSIFDNEQVEKERTVIESEIISALDDPEEAALDAVAEAVWPSHPLSQNICGTVDSVRKITPSMLLEWYKKYIATGELVVCVAGNINTKSISKRLSSQGLHKPIKTLMPFINEKPQWSNDIHYIEADFQQEQLLLLYPLNMPINQETYYSWAILNALIGDTMSSRLFQSLRERGGYCYNVYSFFNLCSDCGFWSTYASVSKEKLVEVVEKLLEEIKLLLTNTISDDEIKAAKEHLCGEEIITSEDIENRMKRLYRNFSFGFEQCGVQDTVKSIRSITRDVLIEHLKLLLSKNNMSLVIYGEKVPMKQKKQIKQLVNGE